MKPVGILIGVGLLMLNLNGCGEDESHFTGPGECQQTTLEEGLLCDGRLFEEGFSSQAHVDEEIPIPYTCAPPTQGPHYGRWSVWGESSTPIPRAHWVHNLEHGGVGLLYRCDSACPELVDELRSVMEAVPVDLSCSAAIEKRVFLTEDPLLPSSPMVAAVAWQQGYTASCVDADTLLGFIDEHYGNAPESLCAQGSYTPVKKVLPRLVEADSM